MAPKRRPTKKGESRMDAALDAMHIYGFSKQLVRATVYGGNEGWVFIEDSSYTLLIDTLLESQLNPSPPVAGLIEANSGDGPNEVTPAGCSNGALLACCKAQTSESQPAGNLALRENHGPKIPQLNHKRRRPCYGWISSDEENEDLTELIPKSPL
ncbi:uncharacterized protein LOC106771596 isoform X2 [Vigna radiata var. radiata]|uniref:Uncharacterized protein LOC106771596 isoform X2 n=1 Tax=Vigna radiata var. radiata TaxID=3916 RepID=A0A1S3V4K5_VIGRR|nr:uncharacterized protein LOC106771596 isoform X2 [Vigna radiata var. radiata]